MITIYTIRPNPLFLATLKLRKKSVFCTTFHYFVKKVVDNSGRSRSSVLWVMNPTRYRCATELFEQYVQVVTGSAPILLA